MFLELVKLSWLSVKEKAGRSALAAFGVFVAFLALTAALSVGEGFKDVISQLFAQLGLNTVWMFAGGKLFTDADVALVQYLLKDAVVIPVSGEYGELALPDGTTKSSTIYYLPPEHLETLLPEAAVKDGGRYIGGRVVMVSDEVKMAGGLAISPGTPLTFKKTDGTAIDLVVAGVYDASGLPGPLAGSHIFADYSLSAERYYFFIYVVLDSPQSAARAEELLKPYFPDASIFTPETVARQVGQFVSVVQLGLGILAGVGALITALWLYDTMMISILQRTKEIGIVRAVGFKRRHIMALLFLEALIVVSIGIAAALPIVAVLSQVSIPVFPGASFKLGVTPGIVAISAALVVAANMLGVALPAHRAARLNIVDALRYE